MSLEDLLTPVRAMDSAIQQGYSIIGQQSAGNRLTSQQADEA